MNVYLHMPNEGTRKLNIWEEDIPELQNRFGNLMKSSKNKQGERFDIYISEKPSLIRRRLTDYHNELKILKRNISFHNCPQFQRLNKVKQWIQFLDKKLAWTVDGLEFLRENDYLKNRSKKSLVKELRELAQFNVNFIKERIVETLEFCQEYPREAWKCSHTLEEYQGRLSSYRGNFRQYLTILINHDIISEKDCEKIMEEFDIYV